jgi:hypothetical protein
LLNGILLPKSKLPEKRGARGDKEKGERRIRNKKPETRNQKLFELFILLPCKKNKS